MPIYEYECEACKNRVEVMQKMSEPPLTTCEACGGSLQRLISPSGLMFKGSGWYVTDYSDKLKDPKKVEKDKTKEASKGKADTAGKKSEKPEKKKDTPTKKEK